jgi:glucan phosphoethanolaminetransferase (alkaline phosphatase superfamily)
MLKRVSKKGDIASIVVLIYASYFANKMGIVNVCEVICCLVETTISAGTTFLKMEVHLWIDPK